MRAKLKKAIFNLKQNENCIQNPNVDVLCTSKNSILIKSEKLYYGHKYYYMKLPGAEYIYFNADYVESCKEYFELMDDEPKCKDCPLKLTITAIEKLTKRDKP